MVTIRKGAIDTEALIHVHTLKKSHAVQIHPLIRNKNKDKDAYDFIVDQLQNDYIHPLGWIDASVANNLIKSHDSTGPFWILDRQPVWLVEHKKLGQLFWFQPNMETMEKVRFNMSAEHRQIPGCDDDINIPQLFI